MQKHDNINNGIVHSLCFEKRHLMFKRKILAEMISWKRRSRGRSALLIQGARRIGKSTTAEEFARREYKSYILIDFSKARQEVVRLFRDISDLDFFFLQLQLFYNVRLYERESLIIFDETATAFGKTSHQTPRCRSSL